jgi:hypothetical protein
MAKTSRKRPKRPLVYPWEGHQGLPMPAGAKPPRGPAADVPVKKTTSRVK